MSVAFTPASVIAAIFACTGQDSGMVGTSSRLTAARTALPTAGCTPRSAFRSRGRDRRRRHYSFPYARDWLALLGCAGSGKVHRFAQIVAAAALALEISAFRRWRPRARRELLLYHHERGGLVNGDSFPR